MHQCCAVGCRNEGVHLFPKDEKNRKKWEVALRRKHFKATKCSRLCCDHFKVEDYIHEGFCTGMKLSRRRLKKGVIPTVFTWRKTETLIDDQRRKRAEKREQRRQLNSIIFDMPEEATAADLQAYNNSVANDLSCAMEVEVIDVTASSSTSYEHDLHSTSTREEGTQKSYQYFSIDTFKDNDKAIQFYTGLERYDKFQFVFATLCPEVHSMKYRWSQVLNLKVEVQFFLTLIKLRRSKQDFELALLFDISATTVSNIFVTWVNFMYQMWSMLNVWPNKYLIQYYMPEGFKKDYPTTRVIIDCTEIPVQKPMNPVAQQLLWSSYKNRSTIKIEIGATPNGLLSHCSDAYGGSTSDRQIVERSCLLDKCERGDSIMADRGFNVQDIFAAKGVIINIPAFLKGRNQLPGATVMEDRKLASKRIHVERLIGQTKTFRFLQQTVCNKYLKLMSKIYFVCQMLCNFREGIVPQ